MPQYTIGLAGITVGDIAGDGGPGTSLTALGETYQNSCRLNMDDPTVTNFYVEEKTQPVKVKSVPGDITLTFQVANADTDTLVSLFGGTATGTSPNKVWNMPVTVPTIEKTVKLEPQEGFKAITIPRGSMSAKLNGEFSGQNMFVIDVTVTALAPTKTGVGPIQFTQ